MGDLVKEITNCSGVYIILNVLDCKAYVGQATEFNTRSHERQLKHGIDNNENLQADYNDLEKALEFIYFVAMYDYEFEADDLNKYEKLYMTVMEDLGVPLYNIAVKRENRLVEQLGVDEAEYERVKKALTEDFITRFNLEPGELIAADKSTRQQALEYYVNQRLDRKSENLNLYKSDRFMYNRARIKKIFGTEERSLKSLDICEAFKSTAGNYIGEGIDQVLNYETKTINKLGYCLWTFANNAVSVDTVRKCCRSRGEQGKDTYVLFVVTPSAEYSDGDSNRHACLNLKQDQNKDIQPEEIEFLQLEKGNKKEYFVPEEIDCTAAGDKSASAFVLQELFLVEEVLNQDALKNQYNAVGKSGIYEVAASGKQRSTLYLQLKDTQKEVDYESLCIEPNHRSFCFVGKLAAPYVVRLDSDERK